MPRKEKEEDRVERIIRGLLKEPENRRCINCNSLGPQYVCTTFWTFVCTNCSGVHREFSHRVKSVSMAKFKAEEISCLQTGGNERAREIYFKAWDPQRNFYPDASNLYKLREFIRHVYIDRKYAGQNSYVKPSTVKSDQRNDSYELQPVKTLSFTARDDIMERRSFERFSNSVREENERHSFDKFSDLRGFRNIFEERRSPRYVQESTRSRNRPTSRFEIVDDRFREDGSMKTYERYSSSKDSRSGSRSPGSQRIGKTSLPAVQPVKDILGEKVPILKVSEPSRPNDGKHVEGASREQKAADSSSAASTIEKQNQEKTVKFSSLIDFDANPEPSCTTSAEPQSQPKVSNTNRESSSAPLPTPERENNSLNMNSVESLLFELSGPVTSPSVGPSQTSNGAEASSGATSALFNSVDTDDGSKNAPEVSSGNGTLSITITEKGQTLNSSSSDSVALMTQLNDPPASNDARQVRSVPLVESSQAGQSGDGSKAGGRKELPADLFVSNFAPFNPVSPGWQMPPPHVIGYGMQYHPPVMMTGSINRSKPSNPFDIADDGPQVQAPTLPSMTSLQGALLTLPDATHLQPQPSPYGASFPSHISPYGMNIPPLLGAYMGPQPNNMMLNRPQGISSFGNGQDAFASINPIQQGTGTEYSSPSAPNSSFSQGRNPFG